MRRPWSDAPFRDADLARAATLSVKRATDETFLVWGGEDHHWVNLSTEADEETVPVCDCPHHTYADALCAHALAALLYRGDSRIVGALGMVVRNAWLDRRLILVITKDGITPPSLPPITKET